MALQAGSIPSEHTSRIEVTEAPQTMVNGNKQSRSLHIVAYRLRCDAIHSSVEPSETGIYT